MQAAGQPDQKTDHRAAENAAQHGTNGTGIGNRPFHLITEVGSHDAEGGKHEVAHQLVRQTYRNLNQRGKERRLDQEIGDHQIDAHLLHQRADKCQVVDVLDHGLKLSEKEREERSEQAIGAAPYPSRLTGTFSPWRRILTLFPGAFPDNSPPVRESSRKRP